MILSAALRSLYALASHLCLTGLPEVQCHIRTCGKTASQHPSRPGHATPSRAIGRSTLQTLHGNVHQVDHVPNGPTNSAAITTMFPLRLCGGEPLVVVTRERRYGPSRQRVKDDDYDTRCTKVSLCDHTYICAVTKSSIVIK